VWGFRRYNQNLDDIRNQLPDKVTLPFTSSPDPSLPKISGNILGFYALLKKLWGVLG
jgi:hypothetical protein